MPLYTPTPERNYLEDHDGDLYMGWLGATWATEIEMCELLYGFVRQIKPDLVVETGTAYGHGTVALAKGCLDNKRGRVVSCELDEEALAKAEVMVKGFPNVELWRQHSLQLPELKEADLVFSDSGYDTREPEYALVKPGCVFIVHDTLIEPPLGEFVKKEGGLLFQKGRGFGLLIKPLDS